MSKLSISASEPPYSEHVNLAWDMFSASWQTLYSKDPSGARYVQAVGTAPMKIVVVVEDNVVVIEVIVLVRVDGNVVVSENNNRVLVVL